MKKKKTRMKNPLHVRQIVISFGRTISEIFKGLLLYTRWIFKNLSFQKDIFQRLIL